MILKLCLARSCKLSFDNLHYNRIKPYLLRNTTFVKTEHCRFFTPGRSSQRKYISPYSSHKSKTIINYCAAVSIFILGLGFAASPLYDKFCKVSGLAGKVSDRDVAVRRVSKLRRVKDRILTVQFNADRDAMLQWNFKPLQDEIKLAPGETVLAFYSAENPTDKPICGVSTYNVVPYAAAPYLNKIQCFCFDEQRLNPHEKVDMPVFFYIDGDYALDPDLESIDNIVLSYTFFEARDEIKLPFISARYRDAEVA